MKPIPSVPLGKYRHFKGNYYELTAVGRDSENPDNFLAVYRALYGEGEVWIRPLDMFFEAVEKGGEKTARFEYVEEIPE